MSRLRTLSAEYRDLAKRLEQGGGAEKIRRQHDQGKLTARERITGLLDRGGPWVEIGLLVASDQYDGQAPAAGVVTGLGRILGRPVVVVANDATVKAGSWWPETIKKILRAQEIAMRQRIPIVYLVDSAGRESSLSGRRVPRPVRRRPDLLLQLDHAPLSARAADRRGDGAVHRRRRVPAGALRRDLHGRRHVLHGTGRSQSGEGRHRADRGRGNARRRDDAHGGQRRRALSRQDRRAVPRDDARVHRPAARMRPIRRRTRARRPSGRRPISTTCCPPIIA